MRKERNKKLLHEYLEQRGLKSQSKILTISNYTSHYTRTESLHQLFEEEKVAYTFINYYPKHYVLRSLLALWRLVALVREHDAVLLHFRGYELFLPVWIVCKLFHKKLIFDHFVSVWDTVCFDRKIVKPYSLLGRFCLWYDRLMIRLADFILIDTQTHRQYFIDVLGCPADKIGYLYVGCNTKLFYPRVVEKDLSIFRVFWYGNVLPLQGVEVILEAAKLCEKEPKIRFVLVGPIRKKYQKLLDRLQLKNTEFIDYVSYDQLPIEICKSDLCLGGHFSDIDKAKRVIAGKTFQFVACGIPTIVGENEANRELYREWADMYFVDINNAKILSDLILLITNGA